MKAKPVRNLAASLRAKLLLRAQKRKEDFQFVLGRWTAERFLYRLGFSPQREKFVLKGATMFLIWDGKLPRPTRDLDFLGYGSTAIPEVIKSIHEICSISADDGLIFDLEKIRAEEIRQDAEYDGVRVFVPASLDKARVTLQIDIGFGDAVDPAPLEAELPVMLDLPAPKLRTYPAEVVIAEKFQAMVHLGIANSRMKDFFDIWLLSREQTFLMSRLRRAIEATFERRKTALPDRRPTALTDAFLTDRAKLTAWRAFLNRVLLPEDSAELKDVGELIARFLMPVVESASAGVNEELEWKPNGPWGQNL
jgi:hypothetical protein